MKKGILLTIFGIMSATLSGQNLYTEIANSDDHSIFLELLEFTGLDSLLIQDDFHSVFAPNNDAFEARYDLESLDSIKLNDPAFLKSMLLNHFTPDTVVVEYTSEKYLPLSGSHFFLFVDGAGAISFNSLGSPVGDPHPYLIGTPNSGLNFVDLNNGRLFWLERSIIHPNCRSTSDMDLFALGSLTNLIIQSSWIDTILSTTTPLTFLSPRSNEMYEYIDQNGGMSNTAFVDSFIRRHIINGYLPLQGIEDGAIVKNLLGEDLFFTKRDNQYYLNESNGYVHLYDFKKSALITFDNFLIEPNISATENTDLVDFKVFPNPASEVITINNSGVSNKSILKIFSYDGNFIHRGEYFGSTYEVDIGDLNPGFYMLEYRNNNSLKRTTLLVF